MTTPQATRAPIRRQPPTSKPQLALMRQWRRDDGTTYVSTEECRSIEWATKLVTDVAQGWGPFRAYVYNITTVPPTLVKQLL